MLTFSPLQLLNFSRKNLNLILVQILKKTTIHKKDGYLLPFISIKSNRKNLALKYRYIYCSYEQLMVKLDFSQKGCDVTAVWFILLIMPITRPYSRNYLCMTKSQLRIKHMSQMLQTTKISFEKTVRLLSFQKPQLQSVSIFHPCHPLYLLRYLQLFLTFLAVICIFHSI